MSIFVEIKKIVNGIQRPICICNHPYDDHFVDASETGCLGTDELGNTCTCEGFE